MQHAIRLIDMRPGRVGDLVPVRRLRPFRKPPRIAERRGFATR
jgi:hypothetical protein